MATVFHTQRRLRVAVYSNDHRPEHVHVVGQGLEARFKLNCPNGPVEFWDYRGDWSHAHLNEVGSEVAEQIDKCCAKWREFHG